MAFNIGEKPGRGRYRCIFSEDIVELETDGDALPACPNTNCLIAHETRWEKKEPRGGHIDSAAGEMVK